MDFPQKTVLVCANQRSGSTLLSRALRDTGLVGTPEEYFLSVDESQWPDFLTWEAGPHAQPGMSRSQYLAAVYQQGTTPNGVFSAKLMWNCVEWMLDKFREVSDFAGLSDAEVFTKAFPGLHVVSLTRHDKIAQAVSWARADQEGVWVVTDQEAAEPVGTPTYDAELIGNLVRLIELGERGWHIWYQRLAISPIGVVYEDLVSDLGNTVARIVDGLGLGVIDPSTVNATTHQQSDALNDEWIERFRSES